MTRWMFHLDSTRLARRGHRLTTRNRRRRRRWWNPQGRVQAVNSNTENTTEEKHDASPRREIRSGNSHVEMYMYLLAYEICRATTPLGATFMFDQQEWRTLAGPLRFKPSHGFSLLMHLKITLHERLSLSLSLSHREPAHGYSAGSTSNAGGCFLVALCVCSAHAV